MSIFASDRGNPNTSLAREGARKALEVLETLATFRGLITKRIGEITSVDALPFVVRRMVLAAREFDDATVTPLIGVAGAGADEVADFIFGSGECSKVVINNGGDIAIRLKDSEAVNVGIKTDLSIKAVTHMLTIKGTDGIGGVATSGFGGRSFTRGVANASVVAGRDATYADVAATLIGNATNIEAPAVVKVLARELYQFTDIPDLSVTKAVGYLEKPEIDEALDRGMGKAKTFEDKGLIMGAFLAVKDCCRTSNSILPFIQQIQDIG